MTRMQSYTKAIHLLVALALVLLTGAAVLTPRAAYSQTEIYPDCSWGCNAGDVTVTKTWLGDANGTPLEACEPGGNVSAYVWAEFYNNTSRNSYAIWAFFDLKINDTMVYTANETLQCDVDTIPKKSYTSAPLWGPIDWECGHEVSIQNLNINWLSTATT